VIVTSTEFQQNVGKYLSLVENGENITVERQKPVFASFIISHKEAVYQEEQSDADKLISKIEAANLTADGAERDAVKLQRRLRKPRQVLL
jgi:hypothetical protein